ncbi:MAG: alpha/beta hydrolase [Candidatus Marinimicrobia bacterium]|nr:alpha/beta hydrolase [Candidatus Neomarinimicrobiota bacterium]MCF7880469.1 alpha/beta hydrolase [Candidatus Neomarinimicrobiota bacterium]
MTMHQITGRAVSSILPLMLAFILFTCSQQNNIKTSSVETGKKSVRVTDNIRYRSGDTDAWLLDLAVPENFGETPRPAIVIIHGGGWRAGAKDVNVYRKMLVDYAFKGYVTISVEYRLIDEAPFPACIEDVKTAVRWLRAHADELNVDSDRIGAFGHSAGAHLAMMVAMTPDIEGFKTEEWSEYSSHVTSVVGGSTPTEIKWEGDIASPKYWPINYIAADHPPMLLIHGTADKIVPIDPVDEFVKQMRSAGMDDLTYMRIDSGNHGVAYEYHLDQTDPAIEAFFERTLKNQ